MSYQHARRTGFAFEYAKSMNQNAENLFSQDGGLTFQPFSRRPQGDSPSGDSFLVKANIEPDDMIGEGDRGWVWRNSGAMRHQASMQAVIFSSRAWAMA